MSACVCIKLAENGGQLFFFPFVTVHLLLPFKKMTHVFIPAFPPKVAFSILLPFSILSSNNSPARKVRLRVCGWLKVTQWASMAQVGDSILGLPDYTLTLLHAGSQLKPLSPLGCAFCKAWMGNVRLLVVSCQECFVRKHCKRLLNRLVLPQLPLILPFSYHSLLCRGAFMTRLLLNEQQKRVEGPLHTRRALGRTSQLNYA